MPDFSIETFMSMLGRYNTGLWPLQIAAALLGLAAVLLVIRRTRYSDQVILAVLSFFWLWTGIIFCLRYWGPVYRPAYVFGVLCILQGFLLVTALFKSRLSFGFRWGIPHVTGMVFILYALAGYQILGHFIGHTYPRFFPLGLVPCPTVIFTFGLLLMVRRKVPGYLVVIPLVIALGGVMAVIKGIYEDIGLLIAGLLGTWIILRRKDDSQSPGE